MALQQLFYFDLLLALPQILYFELLLTSLVRVRDPFQLGVPAGRPLRPPQQPHRGAQRRLQALLHLPATLPPASWQHWQLADSHGGHGGHRYK